MIFGFLTGLASEAALLRELKPCGALVACCAARPALALVQAEDLVKCGANILVSFGIAGAVRTGLRPGQLVLATKVKTSGGEAWEAEADMLAYLSAAMPQAMQDTVGGNDDIVVSVADKRRFARYVDCAVVDQESHIVAAVAAKANIPFIVVRAVADTAEQELPPAALLPLRLDGRPDLLAVFRNIAAHPFQLPELIRIACNSSKAHAALQQSISIFKNIIEP